MKTFGIPVEHLPTNLRVGNIHKAKKNPSVSPTMKNHLKWCAMQQAKDKVLTALQETDGGGMAAATDFLESIVECPRAEDCLFGKGMPIMKHPGNVEMRRLLEPRYERYEAAEYRDKAAIAWEVVNEIKGGSGRFLKEDPDGWFVQVSDELARQKISIAFRDMKRTRQRSAVTRTSSVRVADAVCPDTFVGSSAKALGKAEEGDAKQHLHPTEGQRNVGIVSPEEQEIVMFQEAFIDTSDPDCVDPSSYLFDIPELSFLDSCPSDFMDLWGVEVTPKRRKLANANSDGNDDTSIYYRTCAGI